MLEAGKGSELLEMLENALKENDPAKQKVHPRGFERTRQFTGKTTQIEFGRPIGRANCLAG